MTRRVASNTIYNLAGGVVPLLVSFVTVPLYLHRIGDARYGVLAIVWLFVSYFGVLDMGLSQATANQIAKLHEAPAEERQSVFWTALLLNGAFGMVGAVCLWGTGKFFLTHFFKIPENLHGEVVAALPWIASSVPLATLTGVLTGTLEARGRFLQINTIQVLGSFLYQVVPLGVAYLYSRSLSWLIPAIILARLGSFLPLLIAALRSIPVTRFTGPSRRWVRLLLGYGGWVTVTNLVGPILTALDRFLVGAVLGVTDVAWYSVPFNLASRLMMFPSALVRTLFPEFSKMEATTSTELVDRSVRFIGASFAPVIVVAVLAMRPFLTVWIGPKFATHAAPVGLIFLLGFWINAVAYIPFAYLQAKGRPDIVAKIHLIEVLPFVALLWVAMKTLGLEGGALTWSLRVLVDTALMLWMGRIGKQYVLVLWPAIPLLGCAWGLAAWVPFVSVWYSVAGSTLTIIAITWAFWLEPRLWELFRQGVGRVRSFVF